MCVGNELSETALVEETATQVCRSGPSGSLAVAVDAASIAGAPHGDLLPRLAYQTRLLGLVQLSSAYAGIQSIRAYRALARTMQPAHLLTVLAVLLAGRMLQMETGTHLAAQTPCALTKLVYLASFAAHFGAQIWMTFVSGLSLYFSLPRHTFGSVQKVLFPKYFSLNAVLSLMTLLSYNRCHDGSESTQLQSCMLIVCFFIELTTRLYMTPVLLQLITEKNELEASIGVGSEVGQHLPGPELVACPAYVSLHSMFRRLHMTIAIGNILTMGCTAAHLYYLSSRLCV